MNTLLRITTAVVVVLLLAARPARADAPASCATGLAFSAYKTGLKIGKNLVKSAWANIADCDRIDDFLELVEENVGRLTLPEDPSLSTVCRYTGTADGVYDALDTLYGTCADQCFIDGEFAGRLSAEIYCELSIALEGLVEADDFLRGPVNVCGLNFEIGCDSEFIAFSVAYENTDGECVIYTEGDFEGVWDQVRNNQCAYVIPDPPPLTSEVGS